MTKARPRRERPYATLLLACLLLLGRLAVDVHLATTRHAVCDVHDELIELDACGAAAVRHASTASDASPPGCHVDPLSKSGGHEHCLVAHVVRERPHVVDVSAVRTGHDLLDVVAVEYEPEVRAPSIPGFLLAPKQSPPLRTRTLG